MTLSDVAVSWRNLIAGSWASGGPWVVAPEGIKGWEQVTVTRDTSRASRGIGMRSAPYTVAGRTITISGSILGGDLRDEFVAAWNAATAPLQDPWAVEPLTIMTAGLPLTVDCQLVDAKLGIGEVGYTRAGKMSWALQFECDDPRRYVGVTDLIVEGAPATEGAGVVPPLTPPITPAANPAGGALGVNNTGTAPAPCHIELWGPWVNPGVTVGAGSRFREVNYGFTLGAGDVLDIDTREGAAFLNNTYRTTAAGSDMVSDLELSPGLNTLAGSGSPGAGARVVCRYRPAYW